VGIWGTSIGILIDNFMLEGRANSSENDKENIDLVTPVRFTALLPFFLN